MVVGLPDAQDEYKQPDSGLAHDLPQDLSQDAFFLQKALKEARIAGEADEVPIGAVVVCEGRVVGRGYNRRETAHDPAGHAEVLAIRDASARLGRWRLDDCTVYVTLEPCPMCAGLMHQARIARCVFGARDPKAGALVSLYALGADTRLNHTFEVTPDICADECGALLRDFFAQKRERAKHERAALAETTVAAKSAYTGGIFEVEHRDVTLPDGSSATRDIVRHPGAVAILAFDSQDRVLLEKQWRSALDAILIEIPAGKLDAGEEPFLAAKRELKEETGCSASSWEPLQSFHTSAGFCDERLTIFRASGLTHGATNLDEGEFVESYFMPFDRLLGLCLDGTITDAKTLIAVYHEATIRLRNPRI